MLGVKTLNLVILKSERLSSDFGQVVDEADHGVCALRVKFIVVTSLNLGPLVNAFLRGLFVGVFRNTVLDVIAKVGNKAHAIIQFDVECLVINGSPFSINNVLFTLSLVAAFAKDGFDLVALNQIDSVNIFASELELVALVDHLNLVRHCVRTQLLRVKEIDVALVGTDMEIPNTVQFLTNTVNRLVSGSKLCSLIIEWVDVGY